MPRTLRKVFGGGGGGSTVSLAFCFGPKLWFWTWTKLNNIAWTLSVFAWRLSPHTRAPWPGADTPFFPTPQEGSFFDCLIRQYFGPSLWDIRFFGHKISFDTQFVSILIFMPKQDSSRKCSAWKDFRFKVFSFPRGIGLSVVGWCEN